MKSVEDHEIDYTIFGLLNSLVNYNRMDDHAVPIYKNSHPVNITFSVSKYPSGTLGQFIRKLRLEKGLEQWEVARKLRVHRNTVYEWENDRKGPSREGVEKLARFFAINRKALEDLGMDRKKGF